MGGQAVVDPRHWERKGEHEAELKRRRFDHPPDFGKRRASPVTGFSVNTNSDTQIWNSNGSGGFSNQDLGVVPTSYQIAGTGDFNADGEAGILWRNVKRGHTQIWNPNGSGASPSRTSGWFRTVSRYSLRGVEVETAISGIGPIRYHLIDPTKPGWREV